MKLVTMIKRPIFIAIAAFLLTNTAVMLLCYVRGQSSEQTLLPVHLIRPDFFNITIHNELILILLLVFGSLTRGIVVIVSIFISVAVLWVKESLVYEQTNNLMFSFSPKIPHSIMEISAYMIIYVLSVMIFSSISSKDKKIEGYDVFLLLILSVVGIVVAAILETTVGPFLYHYFER